MQSSLLYSLLITMGFVVISCFIPDLCSLYHLYSLSDLLFVFDNLLFCWHVLLVFSKNQVFPLIDFLYFSDFCSLLFSSFLLLWVFVFFFSLFSAFLGWNNDQLFEIFPFFFFIMQAFSAINFLSALLQLHPNKFWYTVFSLLLMWFFIQ